MTIPFEILLTQWLKALENPDMSQRLNTGRTADVGAFNWRCVVRFGALYQREAGLFVDRLKTLYQVKNVNDLERHGNEHEFLFGI
jgi:hypothetical protein